MRKLILAVLTASLAHAGLIIKQEHGDAGAPAKQMVTLYVEGGKIRVESTSENSKTIMIFDGDKQVLWMIPGRGEYMEMTAATVEQMSQQMTGMQGQMAQAQQAMQAQMANMPPEQRAMMEQMMKQRMGAMPGGTPAALPKITFEPKGGSDKVGQFTCKKYDELADGKRTAEICAASLDQVPVKDADQKAFQALAKFMEPMMKMAPKGSWTAPPIQQLHGFPVHTISYNGATPTYETKVTGVEQKSIDGAMFVLPAGLKKMDMPFGAGGGRPPR